MFPTNPQKIKFMKANAPLVLILFSILFFSFNGTAEAQILKKLKKRVQEATEDVLVEKAAQKTAQETGKALDSLLEIDPDYEQKNKEQWENMFAGGGADVPIESRYAFDTNVLYTMEFSSDDEASEVDYSMWFSDDKDYMATQVSNVNSASNPNEQMPMSVLSVIDEKTKAMIAMITPAMTVIIGGIIGLVAVSLMTTMYSIYGQLG